MNFLSEFLYAVQTLLRLVLLALLVRGPFRKYLVFSAYVLSAFVGDVVESGAYYSLGRESAAYRQVYWTENIALDLLLFLVVITFTYAALGDSPMRRQAAKLLGVIAAAGLILPFAVLSGHTSEYHGHFTSQWFNHVRQIFNFAAAIMNLVLWGALLSDRKRDPQLVSLSIGVGILTSSAAIAWGARRFLAEGNRWPVDTFMLVANIACLLVWCWVFRPAARRTSNATPPNATPPSAPPNALTTPS